MAHAGTVSYQPMEVLHDGRVTRASDVYSFGMIMLEMFTGVAVFDGYTCSQVGRPRQDICHVIECYPVKQSERCGHGTGLSRHLGCWKMSRSLCV